MLREPSTTEVFHELQMVDCSSGPWHPFYAFRSRGTGLRRQAADHLFRGPSRRLRDFRDRFQKPTPFEPDIAVGIDDTWDTKCQAMCALVSQFFEGGVHGSHERVSRIPKTAEERLEYAKNRRGPGHQRTADEHRDLLIKFYGPEDGQAVKYAEVLEICEYGRRPNEAELKKLFPFFSQ